MTIYVDSSALAKRYVAEPESTTVDRLLLGDPTWVTANHAYVEVTRVLHLSLSATALDEARDDFELDWQRTNVVTLDADLCRRAASLTVATATRTPDALHLAAAERAGGAALNFLTFDLRQAQAARSLGWTVIGL